MVAVDDEVLRGVLKAQGSQLAELGERHEFGALKVAELPFIGFAAVDEPRLTFGAGHEAADVFDADFQGHLVHGRGEC